MALLSKRKTGAGKQAVADRPAPVAPNRLDSEKIDYYARREAGVLNFDLIRLEQIEMDPTNPRTEGIEAARLLAVVPKFLVIDPNDRSYDAEAVTAFDRQMAAEVETLIAAAGDGAEALRAFFERLIPLRDSIRLIGVKQPIEIRHTGTKNQYRIVYGHRRYLASILAGERNIPARLVREDAPQKLVQATENLLQESLSLDQRLKAIAHALDELGLDFNTPPKTVSALTGYNRVQVGFYLTILRQGSPALRAAIREGLVDNLRKAAAIAKLPEAEQAQAIEQGASPTPKEKTPPPKKAGRGRRRTAITTPKIKEPTVIKHLLGRLDVPEAKADIDWRDVEAVHQLWNTALERLIKELQKG